MIGIGIDLVDVQRFRTVLRRRNKISERLFTKNELSYCNTATDPTERLAVRFAAKEAVMKALGTGIRKGINFKDIEILNDNFGKPSINLKGSTANFLRRKIKKKKYFIYLSLSDDLPWAQATVVISYK